MITFIEYLKEESSVDAIPAGKQGMGVDPLKNPGQMKNSYDEAFKAAKSMSQNQVEFNDTDRAYVLKYKYYAQEHSKQYVVVHNKQLISQAPDWQQRGYTIIGWVSPKDGVVVRTSDGKYVKDTGQ